MTLKDLIPTGARRKVYAIFALVGLTLSSFQVGFSAADAGQPVWLNVAFAVFGLWATAVGFTARSNALTEPGAPTAEAGFEVKNSYPVTDPHGPTVTTDRAKRGLPGQLYGDAGDK